jgi:chromosome partitioning protein
MQQFGKGLRATITEQATHYEDILVDTGGRGDLTELRAALGIAEKILVPVQASQFDLWTLARMDDLVATARRSHPALGAFVVIGRSSPHPLVSEATEVKSVLADYTQLEATATVIRERLVYRRSIRDGRAVCEFSPPNKKAIQELRSLYEEVFHERQTAQLGVG